MTRAYVGLGSNLGDRAENLARALLALRAAGRISARSSVYRTQPWGRVDQPEFFNAVAVIETALSPHELLDALHGIERRLGRTAGERWGPRVIDLDLLLYDDLTIADEELRVPHERLRERAFVLVPLAEVDERFAAMRDALPPEQLAEVVPLAGDARARFDFGLRESDRRMTIEGAVDTARLRALAEFLSAGDAVRLRIERGDEVVELTSRARFAASSGAARAHELASTFRVETIKADLVGIFHLSRPAPYEGEIFEADRELGYIEALGIRTAVHSMGAGRLVTISAQDDSPVEYGQALFAIARV